MQPPAFLLTKLCFLPHKPMCSAPRTYVKSPTHIRDFANARMLKCQRTYVPFNSRLGIKKRKRRASSRIRFRHTSLRHSYLLKLVPQR